LYTLARTTTLSEVTTESMCKEYMCCKCGDIYYQEGYKVTQVPVTGATPTPSPFVVKEELAETQEPAGPPKLKTEPCIATKEAPTFVNKYVQTMPMEEFTPPAKSISPLLWNSLLRPYLIPLLATLKHRLSYGMSRKQYKNGRKSMLKHRPKACKCTEKTG
jgi:hypothetical protein